MITFFTTPKAFTRKHTAIIQGNAITSWLHLADDVRVLVFGDDPGVGEAAAGIGATHLPEVVRNTDGTPLLDDMFRRARELTASPLLCYVNADIILLPDFVESARAVADQCGRFLAVGRRHTVDLEEPLDFTGDWPARCRELAAGVAPDNAAAIDYFLYPRGMFAEIPAFAVGRAGWDNWMLWRCRDLGAALVDASADILALHQRHDYGHLAAGKAASHGGPEVAENLRLAGGWAHIYTMADATHLLVNGVVRPARTWRHRRQRAFRFLQRLKHGLLGAPKVADR